MLVLSGLGFAVLLHLQSTPNTPEQQLAINRATIETLRTSPPYKRLIARGTEICKDQQDQFMWICGATIRMPISHYMQSSRGPLCSSHQEPLFVGAFPLPEITSAEPKTLGQKLRPDIPFHGPKGGLFVETGYWSINLNSLPVFENCDPKSESACAGLTLAGRRTFLAAWLPEQPAPRTLVRDRPDPETIVSAPGRGGVFLDLDGMPVRHEVTSSSLNQDQHCMFQVHHSQGGYIVQWQVNCTNARDWRDITRGIISGLSSNTAGLMQGASCQEPPDFVRIRPKAHWASVDQNQA